MYERSNDREEKKNRDEICKKYLQFVNPERVGIHLFSPMKKWTTPCVVWYTYYE
jgi:hypothetical protein